MPHIELPQAEFKVVLLGDTHTGKTSLVLRFVEGHYKADRNATIGAFFLTKRLTLDSMTCKLLLWDTAGQPQFQKLAVTYYQQAAAAIVCYDVSGRVEDQIERLQAWLDQVQHNIAAGSGPNPTGGGGRDDGGNHHRIVLVVAACKCDLTATPGLEDEARRLAERYGALYVQTSAKNNTNVSRVFTLTAEAVLQCQAEAATGRGRTIPVTMGGTSLRHRSFSPTGKGSGGGVGSPPPVRTRTFSNTMATPTKSPSQYNPSSGDAAAGGHQDGNDGHGQSNNNNTDSSTAGESDEDGGVVTESDGGAAATAPRIMCDNGLLVCGEGTDHMCAIL